VGRGDGGWGIGDWGLGPIPNPQSPIPNPQSPIPNILKLIFNNNKKNNAFIFYTLINFINIKII